MLSTKNEHMPQVLLDLLKQLSDQWRCTSM